VLRRREDLDLRRREIDGDRHRRDRALGRFERAPEVVARPHLDGRRALAESELRRLDGDRDLDLRAERGRIRLRERRRLVALDQSHFHARETAATRLDQDWERGLVTEEARRRARHARWCDQLAPSGKRDRSDDADEEEEDDDAPDLRAGLPW